MSLNYYVYVLNKKIKNNDYYDFRLNHLSDNDVIFINRIKPINKILIGFYDFKGLTLKIDNHLFLLFNTNKAYINVQDYCCSCGCFDNIIEKITKTINDYYSPDYCIFDYLTSCIYFNIKDNNEFKKIKKKQPVYINDDCEIINESDNESVEFFIIPLYKH